MAQDRMEESSATVEALYGTENPCSIKGAPELGEIMQKFIYSDVNNQVKMPLAQKELLTLVVLTANNTPEDIGIHVKGALNAGATPEEIRETIYQCTPYVGFARSKAALIEMQIAFEEAGVKLPLENQGTTTDADRIARGEQTQVDIFGDRMRGFANSGKGDQAHINNWLSGNCFGDYYTRNGLTLAERELITFCFLMAQGGCEPQLIAHSKGNLNMGNDREFLMKVVSQCLPYIGYPRSLNAICCINKAVEE